MLLLEPSTPTQHDSIPSSQNHCRSLGCQLPSLRYGRASVLVLYSAYSSASPHQLSSPQSPITLAPRAPYPWPLGNEHKKNRTEHWRREHWAVPWAIPTDPNSANCLSGLRSMCVVISQCHVVFQIFPQVPGELSSAGYKTFQRALKSLKCLLFYTYNFLYIR